MFQLFSELKLQKYLAGSACRKSTHFWLAQNSFIMVVCENSQNFLSKNTTIFFLTDNHQKLFTSQSEVSAFPKGVGWEYINKILNKDILCRLFVHGIYCFCRHRKKKPECSARQDPRQQVQGKRFNCVFFLVTHICYVSWKINERTFFHTSSMLIIRAEFPCVRWCVETVCRVGINWQPQNLTAHLSAAAGIPRLMNMRTRPTASILQVSYLYFWLGCESIPVSFY